MNHLCFFLQNEILMNKFGTQIRSNRIVLENQKIKYLQMKDLLKYAGVLIEIIGGLLLIVPALMKTATNLTMTIAGILIVVGFISHIIINKYVLK